MENDDRINSTINRIAPSVSPVGRYDPTALSTKDGLVYRETGFSQIQDIIDCGFVRSNVNRKSNQLWWTYGGKNSFHVNKRPILVASTDVVIDNNIGAISIDDLLEIWIYDEESKIWLDKIDTVREMYIEKHSNDNIRHK